MYKTLTCVIVDDESIARWGVKGYVDKIGWLECIGMFGSAVELVDFLDNQLSHGKKITPDIIFLDIEMPERSGLDFLATCSVTSSIIIITAYEQYALRGYDFNVADYLLKPVAFPRFLKAVEKVREMRTGLYVSLDGAFLLKAENVIHRVVYHDIVFVEAMENYVKVYTVNGNKIVARMTLHHVVAILPENIFMQIHKSFVINLSKVIKIDNLRVHLVGDFVVSVSKAMKSLLLKRLARE